MIKTNQRKSPEVTVTMMTITMTIMMITIKRREEEEEIVMTTMMMLITMTTEVIEVTTRREETTMMTTMITEATEAEVVTDVEVTEVEAVEEEEDQEVDQEVDPEVVTRNHMTDKVVTTEAETMTIKEATIKLREEEDNKNQDKALQSTNSISQLLDE